MSRIQGYLTSSVGKKQIVALTGLGLCGFVLMHMSGNLLLFLGPEIYNGYSHKLISNPLIYVAEVGLVGLFLVHLSLALKLTLENQRARPIKPSQGPSNSEKGGSFASRTMALSGLLLLVFTILHLWTFKYGTHYDVTYDGVQMRDLYRLVQEKFQDKLYTGFYLFSMLVLGLHLSHGFAGAFQSLGLLSVRNCRVKMAAWIFSLVVAGGFFAQPFYFLVWGGK